MEAPQRGTGWKARWIQYWQVGQDQDLDELRDKGWLATHAWSPDAPPSRKHHRRHQREKRRELDEQVADAEVARSVRHPRRNTSLLGPPREGRSSGTKTAEYTNRFSRTSRARGTALRLESPSDRDLRAAEERRDQVERDAAEAERLFWRKKTLTPPGRRR